MAGYSSVQENWECFIEKRAAKLQPFLPLLLVFFGGLKEGESAAVISMKGSQFYGTLRVSILVEYKFT